MQLWRGVKSKICRVECRGRSPRDAEIEVQILGCQAEDPVKEPVGSSSLEGHMLQNFSCLLFYSEQYMWPTDMVEGGLLYSASTDFNVNFPRTSSKWRHKDQPLQGPVPDLASGCLFWTRKRILSAQPEEVETCFPKAVVLWFQATKNSHRVLCQIPRLQVTRVRCLEGCGDRVAIARPLSPITENGRAT